MRGKSFPFFYWRGVKQESRSASRRRDGAPLGSLLLSICVSQRGCSFCIIRHNKVSVLNFPTFRAGHRCLKQRK